VLVGSWQVKEPAGAGLAGKGRAASANSRLDVRHAGRYTSEMIKDFEVEICDYH